MICKLKWEGDRCLIDVGGEALAPVAYMSYAPLKENFEDMKKNGVRLFMFPIYAGDEAGSLKETDLFQDLPIPMHILNRKLIQNHHDINIAAFMSLSTQVTSL